VLGVNGGLVGWELVVGDGAGKGWICLLENWDRS